MKFISPFLLLLFLLQQQRVYATNIYVGKQQPIHSIKKAIQLAHRGDTVFVESGTYAEGNIVIDKPLTIVGNDFPIIDGLKKSEVISIKADYVAVEGFIIKNSAHASLDDPAGIKVYNRKYVTIQNNKFYNNFFAIYLQSAAHCIIKNNFVQAFGKEEQSIGNAIHCWKCDSLQIINNELTGHRDGIYFEFVSNSVIWRNYSHNNIRYGLHFMFSNNDAYFTNHFTSNGAGVAVMFTKQVVMMNNTFEDNVGDASYGLLLKEISDCLLSGNFFYRNTTAVFMDGSNRMKIEKNIIADNGWGLKIQANCMDNTIEFNSFTNNTFDVSTNGNLVLNKFAYNYWDKYQGYDLNKDGIGDVPYRPLSLYAVIAEKNPVAMLLYRSIIVSLLDKTEKIIPTLTPENFIDNTPLMEAKFL